MGSSPGTLKARRDPYHGGDGGDRPGGHRRRGGGGVWGTGGGEGVDEVDHTVEAGGEEQDRDGDGGRGQAEFRGDREGLHEPRRRRRRGEAEECEVGEARSGSGAAGGGGRWKRRTRLWRRGMSAGGGVQLSGLLLVAHRQGRRRRVSEGLSLGFDGGCRGSTGKCRGLFPSPRLDCDWRTQMGRWGASKVFSVSRRTVAVTLVVMAAAELSDGGSITHLCIHRLTSGPILSTGPNVQ